MLALVLVGLVAGLSVLAVASDQFVDGASHIATVAKLSPIIVGAVVLGFGTSAPELVISALAAAQGNEDIGTGNIIGSNVANLSFGLGLAAMLTPIRFSDEVIRQTIPLALGAMAAFTVLVSVGGGLSFFDGFVLGCAMVLTLIYVVRSGRRRPSSAVVADAGAPAATASGGAEPVVVSRRRTALAVVRVVLGLAGVVGGAQIAVLCAEWIAERLNLSGGFIGFSVVAIGTSLPELATVAAAARRKQTELIVGNLFGSNIFNSLAVAGAMGLVASDSHIGHNELLYLGLPPMCIIALLAVGAGVSGRTVKRPEGVALFALGLGAMALVSAA